MGRGRELLIPVFGMVFIVAGILVYFEYGPSHVTFLSFLLGVISLVYGHKKRSEAQRLENALEAIVEEREELRDDLETERSLKEELRSEKQEHSQRLERLKNTLEREGIDTQYVVEKYEKSLEAVLICITHTERNLEPKFIKENLDELEARYVHGATKIIPPTQIDRKLKSRQDLREWFYDNILENQELTYKLELLTVVDLRKVFGEDRTEGDTYFNIIEDIFDLGDLVSSEDLLKILGQSDRISLKDELRENIALLAIKHASNSQFNKIIENQPEIEKELGTLDQVGNTSVDEINRVLNQYLDDSEELAENIKNEAKEINQILSG